MDFVTKRSGFCEETHWILQRNAMDFVTLTISEDDSDKSYNQNLWTSQIKVEKETEIC